MAQETESERLVRAANGYYRNKGIARVEKNDAHLRMFKRDGQRCAIWSSSSGLDYSGVVVGGRHISFELKETEREALPADSIRDTQLDTMESEHGLGGVVFLLVWFRKAGEWYTLDWPELKRVVEENYASIPVRYFQAFGKRVPFVAEKPLYLDQEDHTWKEKLAVGYPEWMGAKHRENVFRSQQELLPAVNEHDLDARRKRIEEAMIRGVNHAAKKSQAVEVFRRGNRRANPERDDQGET